MNKKEEANLPKDMSSFSVKVLELHEKVTDTMTRARLGIFYKGMNRNGGYITEEFADKLLSTISYAPIKGIFDDDDGDYGDHGEERSEGRIYGVVPVDHNLKWEDKEDSDGLTRTYACVDVLLYTALYEEANDIVGKSQSMEIYPPSIKGEWINVEGIRAFKYSSASFLGLQILGDDTEPCFEGSAFFTKDGEQFSSEKEIYEALFTSIKSLEEKLEKHTSAKEVQEGGEEPNMNEELKKYLSEHGLAVFKLSDEDKKQKLLSALNTSEDDVVSYENYIMKTFEDEVIFYNFEAGKYYRMSYEINEGVINFKADTKVEVYSFYGTQEEIDSIDSMRNNENYSLMNIEENFSLGNTKIQELTDANSTLTTEKAELEQEIETLKSYKLEKEEEELDKLNASKTKLIESFSALLEEEVIKTYEETKENFSLEQLDKELSYEVTKLEREKKNTSFNLDNDEQGLFPNPDHSLDSDSDIELIVKKYTK